MEPLISLRCPAALMCYCSSKPVPWLAQDCSGLSRTVQDCSGWAQDRFRTAQDGLRIVEDRLRTAQDCFDVVAEQR